MWCTATSDWRGRQTHDPRYAQLAVRELGLKMTRPQTSRGAAKPDAPMDQEELESDGQDAYHSAPPRLAHLASDRLDIAFACEATQADLARAWDVTGRVGFPTATRWREHCVDQWTLWRRRRWMPQDTTINIWGQLPYWATRVGDVVVDAEVGGVAEQCRMSSRAVLPQWEWRHHTHENTLLLAAAEREKQRAADRKDPQHGQNAADLMMKHPDGKRLTMLCSLWNTAANDYVQLQSWHWTMRTSHVCSTRSDINVTCATDGSLQDDCVFCKWTWRDVHCRRRKQLLHCRWIHERGNHDLLCACETAVDVTRKRLDEDVEHCCVDVPSRVHCRKFRPIVLTRTQLPVGVLTTINKDSSSKRACRRRILMREQVLTTFRTAVEQCFRWYTFLTNKGPWTRRIM